MLKDEKDGANNPLDSTLKASVYVMLRNEASHVMLRNEASHVMLRNEASPYVMLRNEALIRWYKM